MADKKISQLNPATPATGGFVPVSQGPNTNKMTVTAAGAALIEAADVPSQLIALGINGAALPTPTAWSTVWDTAANKDFGDHTIAGPLALTSSDAASVIGGASEATLVANGTDIPTFDGGTLAGWVNSTGTRNLIRLVRVGNTIHWYVLATIARQVGSTSIAPSWGAAPTISAPSVGLSTTITGTASGSPTPTYTYVWKLDGSPISGATASTYSPVTGDYGHSLSVTVTATNIAGTAASTSATRTVGATAPSWGSAPSISAPLVGTATTVTGTASGTAPITYTYVWKLDGTPISGATSSTYTPVSGDNGHTLTVTVTATNVAGSAPSTSPGQTVSTTAVAPSWGAAPTISAPVVGTSTTITGTASGTAPLTYTYAWKLDGTPISGANASTYTPVTGDFGHTLSVTVTATNSQGFAASTSSGQTVASAPVWGSAPSISAPVVGTSTTVTGTATGTATISYTYVWKLDGTPISGATSSTYTPVSGDNGHTLTVTVTASNAYGNVPSTSPGQTVTTAAPVGDTIFGQPITIFGQPFTVFGA